VISAADLLQANATIIVGVLIFLSVTPMIVFRYSDYRALITLIADVLQKTYILWVLILTLCLLVVSTALLVLFVSWLPYAFDIAKGLFMSALGGVVGLVLGLYRVYTSYLKELKKQAKL
jgi:hypothetical protein